jgi:hypothetical protein
VIDLAASLPLATPFLLSFVVALFLGVLVRTKRVKLRSRPEELEGTSGQDFPHFISQAYIFIGSDEVQA